MTVIKDGAGTGAVAQVNGINQLSVFAMTQPDIATAADLGVAWAVDGQAAMTSGVERTVLILTNSGITNIEIGLTFTSVQLNPLNSGISTTIKTYIGNASGTGGTPKTPVNKNTKFTSQPNVGIATNSPTITGVDNEISQFYFQTTDTFLVDYQSSIVLNQGGSYRVTATGAAGTASGLVSHSVRFSTEFH